MNLPLIGQMFKDYNGRIFTVENIDVGNSLGREVQGRVNGKDYSCPLITWKEVWDNKVPPLSPSKMKIG